MLLHVLHETAYDYAPAVRTAQHMAHLKPAGTDGQQLLSHRLKVDPEPARQTEAVDVYVRYTPEGYAGPDDPGVLLRGQLVGQALRSRPLFMVTRDGANTEWDSMPSEEYRFNVSPTA